MFFAWVRVWLQSPFHPFAQVHSEKQDVKTQVLGFLYPPGRPGLSSQSQVQASLSLGESEDGRVLYLSVLVCLSTNIYVCALYM